MGLRLKKQTTDWQKGLEYRQMLEVSKKVMRITEVIDDLVRLHEGPYEMEKYQRLEGMVSEAMKLARETAPYFVYTFEMVRT